MRAVVAREPGGPNVLDVVTRPDPEAGPGEVVIEVVATAVNRTDLLQRQGHYAPPPGATDVLGLECSGRIAGVGEGVQRWQTGDEVCALLSGGGYAERVAVPAGQVVDIPAGIDLVAAAALPEVVATVWSNVFMLATLQPGEAFLVHGGGGGIGTMAIQLASVLGARVACTVGSPAKADACRELGADLVVNYREADFVDEVRRWNESGADVILDSIGAKYLDRNIETLATEGRLVVIGLQGGVRGELDLGKLMSRRGALIATLLRPRPVEAKAAIMASVEEHVWPLIADGHVRPIVDTTLPLDDVRQAHERVASSTNIGKVVLTTGR
jgi:putative PIG3 family NAD(P)H quinone oxidoreductase